MIFLIVCNNHRVDKICGMTGLHEDHFLDSLPPLYIAKVIKAHNGKFIQNSNRICQPSKSLVGESVCVKTYISIGA